MAVKRYYWLKLHDDFFSLRPIKKLRTLPDGDTFVIIFIKMLLLSIKQEGILYFLGLEQSFSEELALAMDENPKNVQATVEFLKQCGYLEENGNREYFLPMAIENTGSEGSSAKRVRDYRARTNKTLQCNVEKEKKAEKQTNKEKKEEVQENDVFRNPPFGTWF